MVSTTLNAQGPGLLTNERWLEREIPYPQPSLRTGTRQGRTGYLLPFPRQGVATGSALDTLGCGSRVRGPQTGSR